MEAPSPPPPLDPAERETIASECRRIVCDAIREEPDRLDPQASLVDDYHIDSMMALGIMVALEKAFDLYIPEDEIAEFDTLEEITALTLRYVEAKRSASPVANGEMRAATSPAPGHSRPEPPGIAQAADEPPSAPPDPDAAPGTGV